MLFAPVRLGSTALSAEVLTADVKNCKHFGPCGVGEKALYLNGFLFDRRYYVALGDTRDRRSAALKLITSAPRRNTQAIQTLTRPVHT